MAIKYIKLPFLFDVPAMQKELATLDNSAWQLHFQVKHYNGNWSAIPLRSIGGHSANGFISPNENATYEDTELLLHSPYFSTILKQFNCPLLAVRLLKLSVGAQIHTHTDGGLCYEEGLVRIHIPIITNSEVDLYLADEKMELQEGECWYMNFNLPHRLQNRSQQDRVHLVIDATVNDWVTELFNNTAIEIKKENLEPISTFSFAEQKEMIYRFRQMNTEVGNKLADDLETKILNAL